MGIQIEGREGLVPATLRPMVRKRVAIKRLLKQMDKSDERYLRYKAYSNALKWLCVVSYGRLGFANSTFGRINAHEVVSFLGREALVRAKEIAEDQGFQVLHAYVDSLFICRSGAITEDDFQPLLAQIEEATKLSIEVEAVYAWMAFVSSRQNPRIPVANRFFGLQPDGEYKIRGLACRREDTPLFVAEAQLRALQILAREKQADQLVRLLPEVLNMVQERLAALEHGAIPPEELLVTQVLSRELEEYRVPSPVARAAGQLQAAGRSVRMGQRIQFLYTRTKEGVRAWDLIEAFDPALIDRARYKELLFRAVQEVLQPLGAAEDVLRNWVFGGVSYLVPRGLLNARMESPLFADR
jgi:DNA polymerase-2